MVDIDTIKAVVDQIVEKFNPEKIILFGSYAYGQPHQDSDVDLLIIMPFQGKSFRQASLIRKAINYSFALDLLLRTPEDAQRRYEEYDPFVRWAFDKGQVLYDKHSRRVAS